VRHLTRSFTEGTLRRGHEVEQLVEAIEQDGRRGLRWASISPPTRFQESDEEGFGQTIGETESAEEAIDLADRELGASPTRWVNQEVLQDEHNHYVKQGRPLGGWQST
jgi:hypothetical protein